MGILKSLKNSSSIAGSICFLIMIVLISFLATGNNHSEYPNFITASRFLLLFCIIFNLINIISSTLLYGYKIIKGDDN